MTDLVDRLYDGVIAARHADPARSRTARLLRSGRAKMAKKLAEEAVEVVIDAMNGSRDAVVKESADLLYNLVVLWVSAGVQPKEVWKEMERRERLFGIAEKLKDATEPIRAARSWRSNAAARASGAKHSVGLRPFAAAHGLCAASLDRLPIMPGHDPSKTGSHPAMLRRLYDWTLSLAARKSAEWWLAFIAFVESSVFVIPAEVLFVPMGLARPDRV